MNDFRKLNKSLLIKFTSIILVCLILTSCIEIKQRINIGKNGSGITKLEITLEKEQLFNPREITNIKNRLQKEGWNILKETEKDGKHFIFAERKFKKISELTNDITKYEFNSIGFLKKSYTLEIEHIKTLRAPILYELSIEVPGRIEETNGTKISSDEVKWNLEGIERGNKLSVKSSGLAISTTILIILGIIGFLVLIMGIFVFNKRSTSTLQRKTIHKNIFCPQCGTENSSVASFCTNCGCRLE